MLNCYQKGMEVTTIMAKLTLNLAELTAYMAENDLTEAELARLMGVSRSTVNRILNGNRGAGTHFIGKLLEAFPELSKRGVVLLSSRSRLAIRCNHIATDKVDDNQTPSPKRNIV